MQIIAASVSRRRRCMTVLAMQANFAVCSQIAGAELLSPREVSARYLDAVDDDELLLGVEVAGVAASISVLPWTGG